MKSEIAFVEPASAEAFAAVRAALSDLREAEAQTAKAAKRHESARDAEARRRIEVGKALIAAKRVCKHGEWLRRLKDEGIEERTARNYMSMAGFMEGKSETVSDLPTYADVGIDRRPRKGDGEREAEEHPDESDPGAVEIISPGAALDLRLGDWRAVLIDVGVVDVMITDPPYGGETHAAATTRDDGSIPTGLTPTYDAWTPLDVEMFVAEWAPRCRGWMVALTSDDLIPAWRAAYRAYDRYDFAPVPCVIRGMSVRIQGDGPSSWAVYAMVSRPRNLSKWGTLPGAYEGPSQPGAKSGRGKPDWLLDKIVGDYSRAGDLVCDPLAGYGTTLRSARRLGRRAVGAEIDPDARREAIVRWRADQQQRQQPEAGRG